MCSLLFSVIEIYSHEDWIKNQNFALGASVEKDTSQSSQLVFGITMVEPCKMRDDEPVRVEGEEGSLHDENGSMFGMWGDFLHQSFQSLTQTESVSTTSTSSKDCCSTSQHSRVRSYSDMSRRDYMKHGRTRQRSDSSTIATWSQASCCSPPQLVVPKPPLHSPKSACNLPSEQEHRHVATALHSHLFPDDIGRQVIIVRDETRSPNAFQIAHQDDEDDLDEDIWF